MIESIDELHKILKGCFKDEKELIDREKFLKIIQENNSEIFLLVTYYFNEIIKDLSFPTRKETFFKVIS